MPLGANKVALFGVAGVSDSGTAVLLSTATASDDASIEFTLPTAYKQVNFGFYNITPATDNTSFTFNGSTDGGSNYNVTKTTSAFSAHHNEADTDTALQYRTANDLAQSTSYAQLSYFNGNGADQGSVGELLLFNPASTTYVKHFYSRTGSQNAASSSYALNCYSAGYFNDGSNDLTNISFKMSSGNISSGTIKMWGIS